MKEHNCIMWAKLKQLKQEGQNLTSLKQGNQIALKDLRKNSDKLFYKEFQAYHFPYFLLKWLRNCIAAEIVNHLAASLIHFL